MSVYVIKRQRREKKSEEAEKQRAVTSVTALMLLLIKLSGKSAVCCLFLCGGLGCLDYIVGKLALKCFVVVELKVE